MKNSTMWFIFTGLFTVLVVMNLWQLNFDYESFKPFWLGWNIAFALNCFARAMDNLSVKNHDH
jgi:hypothetical protein